MHALSNANARGMSPATDPLWRANKVTPHTCCVDEERFEEGAVGGGADAGTHAAVSCFSHHQPLLAERSDRSLDLVLEGQRERSCARYADPIPLLPFASAYILT